MSRMDAGNVSGKVIKGRRCQVCTGCGLCPGVTPGQGFGDIRILTKGGFDGQALSLANQEGIRLITADIGTTTIAMELCGEDGSAKEHFVTLNPQAEMGRDVLSRIEAAKDLILRKKMQEMVQSALVQGTERFLKCLKEGERAVMIIAANTTMSYLLMGWDPRELGQAPFAASHLDGARFELKVMDVEVPCVLLPGFSAFVGGDLYAGAAVCSMGHSKELTLLVDLGTNGEILLGNQDGILATATAAGPAFEGGASRGIWGADMVRYVATLREEGLLDETGLLAEPYFEKGIRIGNVCLTQEGIRGFQVAKAAIMAGIKILTDKSSYSMTDIERVILAGGFGYFLHPADAVAIGLIPRSLGEKAISGGNTALAGAKMLGAALLAKGSLELEVPRAKVINLAMEPEFQGVYLESMALCPMD